MARGAVDLAIDHKALVKERERLVRGVLGAGATAIRRTTRDTEHALEDLTRQAVPGKLWKAWGSRAYPQSGGAREPVGTIYLNGGPRTQGAIDFFTKPGRIKGTRDQYLAIPTAAAGSRGRLRDLTPGEWERRNGVRLRFVYRPGRASLLVADAGTLNARTGAYRPITRARTKADQRRGFTRGEATVVIFVLIASVRHQNRFSIQPTLEASEGQLAREFFNAVRALR